MTVPVISWNTGVPEKVEVKVPVIDVHELLSYLHCELGVATPRIKVREWWEQQAASSMPHAVNFPGSYDCIPFSLYGDECNLGQDPADSKVTAIFLSLTLFKPKVVKHGHHLLFAMKDSEMVHENLETLTPVLRHIVWSSNVALTGRFPASCMLGEPLTSSKQLKAGTPLAHGRCFAACELKGDWLWHQRVLRLKDIPVARKICFLCEAHADDQSQLKYYDDSEAALWRGTMVDTTTFINTKVRTGQIRSFICKWYCCFENLKQCQLYS